ncbi:transposase-like protein [Robbsia andropogonis]
MRYLARFCRNKWVWYSEDPDRTIRSTKQNLTTAMPKVFKRLHYLLDVMLLCVRYLYRAIDKAGNMVDFLLRAQLIKAAAQAYS